LEKEGRGGSKVGWGRTEGTPKGLKGLTKVENCQRFKTVPDEKKSGKGKETGLIHLHYRGGQKKKGDSRKKVPEGKKTNSGVSCGVCGEG